MGTVESFSLFQALTGAVLIFASVILSLQVLKYMPVDLRTDWRKTAFLIIFFFIGYIFFVLIRVGNLGYPLEPVTTSLFLGSACFVYFIVLLIKSFVHKIHEYEEDIKDYVVRLKDKNDELEQEVGVRKQAEERLRSFEKAVETMQIGVTITDISGKILYANPADAGMHGFDKEDLVGKEARMLAPQDLWNPSNQDQLMEMKSRRRESVNIRKDGSTMFVQLMSDLVTNPDGTPIAVVTTCEDITPRKRAEEERLRTSKLESIGVLAGGIAHDFNNLLTAIMGNISIAIALTRPEDKSHKVLASAEKASLKARDLTQQLLTFARGGAPLKRTASIARLIKDSASFAKSGSNVRCEFNIAEDLLPVEVDEGQVGQVIQNLVLNAGQAMPGGGTVEVRAENASMGPDNFPPLREGKYVKITVKDHGIGIPEKDLPKIFDPYFTTKPHGSGLGLASVHSIITKHDGHISVESEVGAGSSFHIYLPASSKWSAVLLDDKEMPIGDDGPASGKVLVMDDETVVRDTLGFMLKLLGYRAEFAADSSETVTLYKKATDAGSPFDAVIMDLTIPGGIGGKETIKLLLELDPDVKAVVSSGYSNDPIMSEYARHGFKGVIAKPYEINGLGKVLRNVVAPKG